MEPMSEERLAELLESFREDERLYEYTNEYGKMNYSEVGFRVARTIIPALLAEVERLRAREVALLAVAQDVADGCTIAMWPAVNGGNDKHEPWCAACLCIQPGDDSVHADDCPVTQVSALLAR